MGTRGLITCSSPHSLPCRAELPSAGQQTLPAPRCPEPHCASCPDSLLFVDLWRQKELQEQGEIRVVQLGFDLDAHGILFTEDYRTRVRRGPGKGGGPGDWGLERTVCRLLPTPAHREGTWCWLAVRGGREQRGGWTCADRRNQSEKPPGAGVGRQGWLTPLLSLWFQVLKACEGRTYARAVQKFLDSVLPACGDLSFQQDQMTQTFGFRDPEIT